ncbi:MAG TPA: sulfur carrier protein ThiS [Candidatus Baltobacteraceae bacterium]|nr:sulfur carrier protein ThiS [Candidatus Baltobacteraceae bacterium]
MRASVNGRPHELPEGTTVAQLLERLGAPSAGIAVAKNDRVVRRSAFPDEAVQDGDRIEIIQAVSGG